MSENQCDTQVCRPVETMIWPVEPTEKQYIRLNYDIETAGMWVLMAYTSLEGKRELLEIILNDLTKINRVGFFCNEQEFSTVSASLLPKLCGVNGTLKAPSFPKKWVPYNVLRVKVETTGPTTVRLCLGPVIKWQDVDAETVAKIQDGVTVPTKVWRVYEMTPNRVLCISEKEDTQPCAFYTNTALQVETETPSIAKFTLHPGEIVTYQKLKEQVGPNLIFTSFGGGTLNVEWQVPAYYKQGTVKFLLD